MYSVTTIVSLFYVQTLHYCCSYTHIVYTFHTVYPYIKDVHLLFYIHFIHLLVDQSLHDLACRNLVARLIYMTSSISYSLITLKIDDLT